MGKSTFIHAVLFAGLFVSATHMAPGGGGGMLFADQIQPGDALTRAGVTIQNHRNSLGPITATLKPAAPGGQPAWKKIEIDSGDRATIDILEHAPAGDLAKLRVFVKGTGRLRLTGRTGAATKPLGQYLPSAPGSSTGIIVSGLGAQTVDGDFTNQIVVRRENVVVRTTTASSGTRIAIDAPRVTLLLGDSSDVVEVNASPVTVMQY